MKKIKPEYEAWRRRIEGQIRHTINDHPEWFNLPDAEIKDRCIRSTAKRIIGEIVAGSTTGKNIGLNESRIVTLDYIHDVQVRVRHEGGDGAKTSAIPIIEG